MRIPEIVKKIFPSAIWNIKTPKKELFLTFDDGPDPEVTPMVLDILEKYNAKGTFFCVGEMVYRNPALYQQIINAGHQTGNHTYNHLKGWKTENNLYFENIKKADKLIHSNLFRPPYGRISFKQFRYLRKKYKIVLWEVLSRDYSKTITKEKCLDIVIKDARPGSIVVFHDAKKMKENILYALPKVLEHFTHLGYTFPVISIQ